MKPALRAKRITAEHHPVSAARRKSFLTLRRTVSVLCALRPDWPYCTLAHCTLRYSQLSTERELLNWNVNLYCHSVYPTLTQATLHIIHEFLSLCAHVSVSKTCKAHDRVDHSTVLKLALRTKRFKTEHRQCQIQIHHDS